MEVVVQGSVGWFGQGLGQLRGSSVRWRRPDHHVAAAESVAETAEAAPAMSHGLSEEQLRALIAQDLRAFVRRPMAPPPGAGASAARPFLLDRLMGRGF